MSLENKKVRALGLCSGGLDSTLAGVVLRNQGVEVSWISFETPFFDSSKAKLASEATGIPLVTMDITEAYLEMMKDPPAGFGKNMNPCKDCHAMMFRFAGKYMDENGFDFLFSGEVAGQRPMSQTKPSLRYVEKHSGYDGYILRPLSAKVLPETDAEKKGLVDREKLYGISGRSRKEQIQLAKELGVTDYPAPAGGCLLTDEGFSRRLKDLFECQLAYSVEDIDLLKFGRHLRISQKCKIVVGRTKGDNNSIQNFFNPEKDVLIKPVSIPGPTVLVKGDAEQEDIEIASSICVGYTKTAEGEEQTVSVEAPLRKYKLKTSGMPKEQIGKFII